MTKEKPLTQEQKMKIYEAIGRAMASDDREPRIVIEEDYRGDEDAYLRVMARWHNVQLDTS